MRISLPHPARHQKLIHAIVVGLATANVGMFTAAGVTNNRPDGFVVAAAFGGCLATANSRDRQSWASETTHIARTIANGILFGIFFRKTGIDPALSIPYTASASAIAAVFTAAEPKVHHFGQQTYRRLTQEEPLSKDVLGS